jgi:hypothetical protein
MHFFLREDDFYEYADLLKGIRAQTVRIGTKIVRIRNTELKSMAVNLKKRPESWYYFR